MNEQERYILRARQSKIKFFMGSISGLAGFDFIIYNETAENFLRPQMPC